MDVALTDPDFWGPQAGRLDWAVPPQAVHTPGEATWLRGTWFEDGRLNVAVNCVDRHVDAGRGGRVAVHFEGEPGDRRSVTYAQLQEQVARAANALEALGVRAGDRVIIYLPVLVETIVATLACARIGAIHSLVFGGFSAEALRFRIRDTGAKVVITSDGQNRRGTPVEVKSIADDAIAGSDSVEHVVVVRRTSKAGTPTQPSSAESRLPWTEGRDHWWHSLLAEAAPTHEAQAFPAETPLLIVYTSGTTGKPKGLVHTMGGYLVQAAYSHALLFDLLPERADGGGPDEASVVNDPERVARTVHWCTADLAWVTAHTYAIYGPLVNGVTEVIYEGTPVTPHAGRHFEIIERYGVTSYYTAPTLVRTLMKHFPDGVPDVYSLGSVRLVGTVGEAVNPAAWRWLHDEIGGGRVAFIDTWWQSETGATVMSPRPGDFRLDPATGQPVRRPKPGSATRALPGLETRVVDEDGATTEPGVPGNLVVTRTGPALARTVWGDPERYRAAYFSQYPTQGWFLSGDGAYSDEDGDIRVTGRLDDVINISGHRLSTIEIESALVAHSFVVEAGVAPVSDATTGHAALACVVLTADAAARPEADVAAELRAHVAGAIGPIAKPAHILRVPDVPKTRSGKIMRRLLGDIFEGRTTGDTTSLQNADALDGIVSALRSTR